MQDTEKQTGLVHHVPIVSEQYPHNSLHIQTIWTVVTSQQLLLTASHLPKCWLSNSRHSNASLDGIPKSITLPIIVAILDVSCYAILGM